MHLGLGSQEDQGGAEKKKGTSNVSKIERKMGILQNCSKSRVFDVVKHSSSVLVNEMQRKFIFGNFPKIHQFWRRRASRRGSVGF